MKQEHTGLKMLVLEHIPHASVKRTLLELREDPGLGEWILVASLWGVPDAEMRENYSTAC